MEMNLSKLQEMVKDRKTWHAVVHKVGKSQKWLSYETTTTIQDKSLSKIILYE